MFDRTIRSIMQRRKLLIAAPTTTVAKAARSMARKNTGAVLVLKGKRLLGIFTERDIAFRVVAQRLDTETTRIGDVMTPTPHSVHPDQLFGYALLVMHDGGFRHLPVVEEGKPIGIISARSAMDPDLEEFVTEAERRKHYPARRERRGERPVLRGHLDHLGSAEVCGYVGGVAVRNEQDDFLAQGVGHAELVIYPFRCRGRR